MSETFAAWLNKAKGIKSGNQLAKDMGAAQSQVSRWLTGRAMPSEERLPALAKALGVSVAETKAAFADASQTAPKVGRPRKVASPPVVSDADLRRIATGENRRAFAVVSEETERDILEQTIVQLAELALSPDNGDRVARFRKVSELVTIALSAT